MNLIVGNILSCVSPSTGIKLYGSSLLGTTINLQSSNIFWDTSTCVIDTHNIDNNSSTSDIIWLHPNCNHNDSLLNDTCNMYLGNDTKSTSYYSL